MSRADHWKSDSQANAEALARRDATYTAASGRSFEVQWDWHQREPRDLRECVRAVIQAYADEVPSRLHEHATGEDGTPRMHPAAESYIFGWAEAGYDPDKPIADYYRTPFKAALSRWLRQSPPRAQIVAKVALGSKGPQQAAVEVGVPPWCAKVVAEHTLRAFLRDLSDIKITLQSEGAAA